jgi:transcription elongation factor Elf1
MQIGQVKYMLAGKKLFKGTGPVSVMEQPEPRPYTCPACGTPVFEKCESCGEIRHAQLDHCASCGAKTETAF